MKKEIIGLALAAVLWGLLTNTARAQYINDPYNGMTAVTNETGSDSYPQIAHLGSGYTLVIWVRPDGDDPRIKYQILNQQGQNLLGATGAYMFDGNWQYGFERRLIPDGAGGAICVVSDARSGYRDIYGQRFDALGNRLWGPTGLPLVVWPGAQDISLKDANSDPLGNFFVSWSIVEAGGNVDAYAQKFDLNANCLWGDYGVPVSTAPGSQVWAQIVPDASGGALVLWEDNRGSPYNYYLYVQHLNPNGLPLLETNGVELLYNTSPLGTGGLYEGVPDGRGGGVWVYTTPGATNHLNVIRVNGRGQLFWLWISPYYASHYIYDAKRHTALNTVWISAYDNRPGAGANYLYQFDIRGNALFGTGGIPYGGGSMSETSNGMIIFRPYQVGGGTRYSAYRVSSRGRLAWVTDVALSGLPGVFDFPVSTSDGADGAIIAFEDNRNEATNPDISAQRVQYNGQLGNPTFPQSVADGEGQSLDILTDGQVQFVLAQAGQVKLDLFDILGRRIAVLQEGYRQAGMHSVKIDDLALPSGAYLARLTTSSGQQVAKMAIAR